MEIKYIDFDIHNTIPYYRKENKKKLLNSRELKSKIRF